MSVLISKFDFYTLSGTTPVRLVDTTSLGHRAHLLVFADGTFAVDGSSGASNHSTTIYSLPQYSSSPNLIKEYGTDMGEPYYRGSDGVEQSISQAEYQAFPDIYDLPQFEISWNKLQ